MSGFTLGRSGAEVRFILDAYGNRAGEMPINVEVFDQELQDVYGEWRLLSEDRRIEVEPGVYGVRISTAAGPVYEKPVRVGGDGGTVTVPIHEISPHEDHEWAYFSQPIDPPSGDLLSDEVHEGLWLRRWERVIRDGEAVEWQVMPKALPDEWTVSRNEDGVTYSMGGARRGERITLLQVGGEKVPWKFVALPPTQDAMVLVRPTAAPHGFGHPVDVVVSSDDWWMETLLSLLQRGDLSQASRMDDAGHFAEQMLYGKVSNPSRAAVGGYYLLRVRDFGRLHDWANNLANWNDWMPDGAIIHAWQMLEQARSARGSEAKSTFAPACDRLLEALRRGVPLYTEGLRLLRDGLTMFANRKEDTERQARAQRALAMVNAYAAAADWSAKVTTFTGARPDEPTAASVTGIPDPYDSCSFVFDVPPRFLLDRGILNPGMRLVSEIEGIPATATVQDDGLIRLEETAVEPERGKSFRSLGALQKALTGKSFQAWDAWKVAGDNQSIGERVQAYLK